MRVKFMGFFNLGGKLASISRRVFILFLFFGFQAHSSTQASVCYVTSSEENVSISILRKNYLWQAALLAHSDWHASHPEAKTKIQHLDAGNDEASLILALRQAKSRGCKAVIGLLTSREALTAAIELPKLRMFGISSTASHPNIQAAYPYLMTARPSAQHTAKLLAEAVPAEGQVFIIRDREEPYSRYYSQTIAEAVGNRASLLDVFPESPLQEEQLARIRQSQKSTIVFTLIALKSIPPLVSLLKGTTTVKSLLVIGSPSWAMDPQTVLKQSNLVPSNTRILMISGVDHNSHSFLKFRRRYKDTYGSIPEENAAYLYDVTKIALECVERASHLTDNVLPSKLASCAGTSQHKGASGDFKYKQGSSFSERKTYFYSFDELMREPRQ